MFSLDCFVFGWNPTFSVFSPPSPSWTLSWGHFLLHTPLFGIFVQEQFFLKRKAFASRGRKERRRRASQGGEQFKEEVQFQEEGSGWAERRSWPLLSPSLSFSSTSFPHISCISSSASHSEKRVDGGIGHSRGWRKADLKKADDEVKARRRGERCEGRSCWGARWCRQPAPLSFPSAAHMQLDLGGLLPHRWPRVALMSPADRRSTALFVVWLLFVCCHLCCLSNTPLLNG